MNLFKLTPNEILETEIGWCEPWIFTFNDESKIVDFEILKIYANKSSSKLPLTLKI